MYMFRERREICVYIYIYICLFIERERVVYIAGCPCVSCLHSLVCIWKSVGL